MVRSDLKSRVSPQGVNGESPLRGARIIIVLGSLELGGAERQALLFARYLMREHQAQVQAWGLMGQPGRAADLCDEYGIPWRMVSQPWAAGRYERPLSLARFARQLRQARPDIILPYTTLPNLACGLVWRWTGARLCIWNQRDDGVARLRSRYESYAVRWTPLFTANSEHGAEHLIKDLNVPVDRVRVVPNGIELAPPAADRRTWRERLGVSNDTLLACMVAALSQYKDHETLLKAWRIVLDQMRGRDSEPPVLLLAGRLEITAESAKALAYDLDLGRNVRFLGQVADISGLLGAVDLGVFSSVSEGSPNAVMESMASGLALAATDIPPVREVLPAESHAFLAPRKDAESLAARILELFTNPELRARLGAANRLRIETDFNPGRFCDRLMEVIATAIEK